MSKQYLTIHTLEDVHQSDIFALAPTNSQLISASGSSSILVHDLPETSPSAAASPENHIPKLVQKIEKAHPAGIHHLAAAVEGNLLISAGFGGEVLIWKQAIQESGGLGDWELAGRIKESLSAWKKSKASAASINENGGNGGKVSGVGELWSLAVTANGRYLAASSYDGRLRLWDMLTGEEKEENQGKQVLKLRAPEVVRQYDTRGSFGICVAVNTDGKFAASGHENGGIFIFNNESGRLLHTVTGQDSAIRALAFSPASSLLAVGGDSKIVSLFDVHSGEHISNLNGHAAWVMSLDFNSTGEWLLSGSYDGKSKVWGMGTRACVATHGETDKPIWAVKWLPKSNPRTEMFVVAGAAKSIAFYREASGGV